MTENQKPKKDNSNVDMKMLNAHVLVEARNDQPSQNSATQEGYNANQLVQATNNTAPADKKPTKSREKE